MSANDDTVSVGEAFGGWPGMDGQDSGTEDVATETAPVTEPEAPAEADSGMGDEGGSDTLDEEQPTPDDVPEWKAYGFKDENAMWASFKEAQRYITSLTSGQPQEEEEPEEEVEAPPTWQSHQFQALGEIPRVGLSAPQREQLADLMAVDPKAAALWAMTNREHMEPGDYKAVQNNWANSDPEEYHDFRDALREHMRQQETAQAEESRNAYVLERQREDGIRAAKEALPLMDERSDEFGNWLAAPENKDISNMLDGIQDPERLRNALVSAFYQYAGPQLYSELMASHQQAAAQQAEAEAAAQAEAQAQAQKGQRASTQTRTAASSTSGGGSDADDAIRAAIANPHGLPG